jgi:Fe2+ transport system protein FeoA
VTASLGPARYTSEDRKRALAKIEAFVESARMRERVSGLYAAYYGDVEQQPDQADAETMDHLRTEGHRAFVFWAFFDAERDGESMADLVLRARRLPPGEAAYLRALREAPMRLYEVVGLQPGRTVTLRDALGAGAAPVKVRERAASRALRRGDLVATRVVVGASGTLELDGGFFVYEPAQRERVLAAARAERTPQPDGSTAAALRALGPTLHIAWRTS